MGERIEVALSDLVVPSSKPAADPDRLARYKVFRAARYTPILVQPLGNGQYEILNGVTRYTLARYAGVKRLTVEVFSG